MARVWAFYSVTFLKVSESTIDDRATFNHSQTSSSDRICIGASDDQEIRIALGARSTYRNTREGIIVPILANMPYNMREMLRDLFDAAEKRYANSE